MGNLTELYDNLKSDVRPTISPVGGFNKDRFMNLANKEANNLSNSCAKKILLDIYCRVIPLDSDYVKGHMGVMKQDIDKMLASKDQTPLQYFTSNYEKTDAPLLEFIIRNCNHIGKQYMEAAEKIAEDNKKNDINTPPPSATADIVDSDSQVDDITGNDEKGVSGDNEYEQFIEKIKKKTITRVINEVSDLINAKKDSKKNEINFGESAVGVAADYLSKKLWTESAELKENQKEMVIGMAIREATLNMIDSVLSSEENFIEYRNGINFGKGIIVNESAVNYIKEMA